MANKKSNKIRSELMECLRQQFPQRFKDYNSLLPYKYGPLSFYKVKRDFQLWVMMKEDMEIMVKIQLSIERFESGAG